jgi:hypothetical protein
MLPRVFFAPQTRSRPFFSPSANLPEVLVAKKITIIRLARMEPVAANFRMGKTVLLLKKTIFDDPVAGWPDPEHILE